MRSRQVDAPVPDRLDRVRGRLEAEREALLAELRCVLDPGCAPTDLDSRDALEAALRSAVREVEDALDRIGRGTFGRCEDCGERIDPARLRALPRARRCLSCQLREDERSETRRLPRSRLEHGA
ncbi:MAG TPA: TraR/DksA C4-type zinc finger protein [Actinomycetota bacterium]|nr:TraR/DksA C4-type zinc finger protein [Actinomycetota bacterium]